MKWRVPLYVVLAALGIYWFGKWSEHQGEERADIIGRAEVSLSLHKSFVAQQAKLRLASKVHVTSARFGTVRLIEQAPTLVLRTDIRTVTDDWEASFRAESTRADQAELRIADLERNLAGTLSVADCHMLGVRFFPKCASRTVSFVLGAGVAVVGYTLTR